MKTLFTCFPATKFMSFLAIYFTIDIYFLLVYLVPDDGVWYNYVSVVILPLPLTRDLNSLQKERFSVFAAN
jgi:hypothetical protein